MSASQKLPPGPPGKSCLTCRQRHKKCDRRRPICAACERGRLKCLGYDNDPHDTTRPSSELLRQHPTLRELDLGPTSDLPGPPEDGIDSHMYGLPSASEQEAETLDITEWELLDTQQDITLPSASPYGSTSAVFESTRRMEHAEPHEVSVDSGVPTSQVLDSISFIDRPSAVRNGNTTQYVRAASQYYNRIPYAPYHLSKTLLGSSMLEDYIMAHWDHKLDLTFLKSAMKAEMPALRASTVSLVQNSSVSRWIRFITSRICESSAMGDTSQNQTYELWINQIDQLFRDVSLGSPYASEINNSIGNWLEALLMKTMVVHNSSVYRVLHSATFAFIQIVYSDPSLWLTSYDLTCVPLTNVMSSPRSELQFFVMADATIAMAFGLPQRVEYSFDSNPPPAGILQYANCYPTKFLTLLAEINACRDNNPRARAWQEIMHHLLAWEATKTEHEAGWDSWISVAWLAVQECWRQMLLAYLYMSVCGASSDDPRVQSSVQQIIQISETVKERQSSNVKILLFLQYLMAGIGARTERHRSAVRERLLTVTHSRFWQLRAGDFVMVLDDLWHGAAAGGRPIQWSDYVRSRERVLPVEL